MAAAMSSLRVSFLIVGERTRSRLNMVFATVTSCCLVKAARRSGRSATLACRGDGTGPTLDFGRVMSGGGECDVLQCHDLHSRVSQRQW